MSQASGPYHVMKQRPVLHDGAFEIRAVEPEHIEAIRNWRNDQIDVLRQSQPISREEQIAYFERAIWPDKARDHPSNILLGLFEDGQIIGYGGLVHMAWDYGRAEVSFLLATEISRDLALVEARFKAWLVQMQDLAFNDLGLTRLTTETYEMRTLHIGILEQVGFQREGRLRQHVKVQGQTMDALVHGCLAADLAD